MVASTDPIERRLSPILEAADQAIVEYESRISQFTSPTDALSLMEALAGPQASRRRYLTNVGTDERAMDARCARDSWIRSQFNSSR